MHVRKERARAPACVFAQLGDALQLRVVPMPTTRSAHASSLSTLLDIAAGMRSPSAASPTTTPVSIDDTDAAVATDTARPSLKARVW